MSMVNILKYFKNVKGHVDSLKTKCLSSPEKSKERDLQKVSRKVSYRISFLHVKYCLNG